MILVRNDIIWDKLEIHNFNSGVLEIHEVIIKIHGGNIDILNVYNPGKNISKAEIIHYIKL